MEWEITALKILSLDIKMFHPLMSLAVAALFFVLTPGILVSLPSGKGKFVVAATHAVIFALVFHFTHKAIWNVTQQYELFDSPPCTAAGHAASTAKPCCTDASKKTGMC
jgi:hypothetical protein